MYELQTEVKTRPYLKDVQERRLPSTRRARVQERELQLMRMQRAASGADSDSSFGRTGGRVAAWLKLRPARPADAVQP